MVTGYLPVVVLFLSVELPFLALQVLLGKKMLISIFVYLISMMQIFKIQTHPTFSNWGLYLIIRYIERVFIWDRED